ncbi:Sodium channel protein type 4 subunit alpha B [Stylophora pistillata]|uniref:Sodium channel protein n=1 Tax=Stylophora pistillata TaxID=50429 RepID=A0A2B4RKW5_STYPI|nr:Sodium channel protein type 4 subunit alpha B [Stylophora pistillata]
MADYSYIGNGSYKSLVKDAEISRVVMTVQGPREMLPNNANGLPALPGSSTFKKGQLRQAPSYLLGKPLHDFDATGNGCFQNVFIPLKTQSILAKIGNKVARDYEGVSQAETNIHFQTKIDSWANFERNPEFSNRIALDRFLQWGLGLRYVTLSPNVANFSGIRTVRVLRALRTISVLKGFWIYEEGRPVICGNGTAARRFFLNYTCLPDAGPNPDFGYTNFDHMGWSLVLSFQLLTMDFWENIYNKILASSGIWTQKKVEEITYRVPKEPPPPSLFRLIGSKNSFKEILDEKMKNDAFRTDMKWTRRLQRMMCDVMGHSIVEVFFLGFILANTVVLAVDHHQIDSQFKKVLDVLNLMFTIIFTVEMILKLVALGPLYYIQGKWNIFDGIIVIISLVDTGLELADFKESSGTSVFRTFRLFRILKLAQSWETMRRLLSTISNSVGPIGNITLILGLVIYIFALMGMKMFGKSYTPEKFGEDGVPRWNFNDFWHAFMMVFRVLCGEWIEPLWDCMRATSPAAAIPFFIPAFVIGNFIVLNLFLALLLNAFDSGDEEDEEGANEDDDEEDVVKKLLRKLTKTRKTPVLPVRDHRSWDGSCNSSQEIQAFGREKDNRNVRKFSQGREYSTVANIIPGATSSPNRQGKSPVQPAEVDECFPEFCMSPLTSCACCKKITCNNWLLFRWRTRTLVEHRYFEWFILFTVLISSLVLVFEDVYLPSKPTLQKALENLNYFFAFIFALEFVLKLIGLGLVGYFSSFWNCLDSLIVAISLVCVFEDQTLASLRSLRTVRALRPLRAVSRLEGMKVVVNALFSAIPGIANVLLVSLLFWLIFSILGVQLFAGKFYKCIDMDGERVPADLVSNKSACLKHPEKYRWVNSNVNFDNVINGFLALFQVATFEGWMELMDDAVDSKEVDEQPADESYLGAYFYFVIFIVMGAFFVLNLFVGVIIDNFNSLKRRYDELSYMGMLLTDAQRKWVDILKESAKRKPPDNSIRPQSKILQLLYDLVTSEIFEMGILGLAMDELTTGNNSIMNPGLLRVFRVARVARLLRILQFAKGIRQLLVALIISLPALLNVGTLLFLVIFIYAIIGMSTFGHVKKQKSLDNTVNFETFGRSMMLLFRLSTGAGWNDILESLMLREPDCDPDYEGFPNGNCGYPVGAVIYLVSYIFIVFLIIVNMYIAIILENVNRAQEGGLVIKKEDLDSYYEKWALFVTDGKQYLLVDQVSDFVALLNEPFKIPKPNEQELVRMGINVRMGYRVQCFDLLRCLVKRLLEQKGESPLAFEQIASKLETHFRRRGVRKKSRISKSRSTSNEISSEEFNNVSYADETLKEDGSTPAITAAESGSVSEKNDSSPKNSTPPRTKYRDPISTALMFQSAIRRFLDKRRARGTVTFPMTNGFSSESVQKCSCSPLSSISSDQEVGDFMFGLELTPGSRSQISFDSAHGSNSPGCLSYDPFDSDGDSV